MQKLRTLNLRKIVPESTFLLVTAMMPFLVSGQDSMQTDTLLIKEVIITRKLISSEQPGFKFYTLDSGRMNNYSGLSINDLLRDATPLFIKEYGAGLTATSSFRGTSAGHTQVLWNGISINDPMLGQTDFSLIPAGMVDNVMVSFGGASMDLGSGGIGGVINLGNEPSWRKETIVDLAPGAGSFGQYTGLARVTTGGSGFQSVTRAFINSADFNFRYLDTEAPSGPQWKSREHNGALRRSLMQELYFRRSGDVVSARIWYQNASRELPGSTLYGYWGENQTDESLRSLISYDAVRGKKEFFSSAAWIHNYMHYTSIFDTVGSKNRVNTLVMKGGMTIPLAGSTLMKIVLNDELNLINSNYYSEKANQNNASLTLSAERKKNRWFGAALLVRQTLYNSKMLAPDFSAGMEIRIMRAQEHYIKFNVSRNSKIPSMNDRFWNPGGNPDLKNEYAYSAEAGYSLKHNLGSSLKIAAEVNYFNNYIRNMIRWYPDTLFNWIAGNIGSVNTSGIESSVSLNYRYSSFSLDLNAGYSYTRAIDISAESTSDKQMIYIPEHQANGAIQLSYRNIYAVWMSDFTSRIFTIADHSDFLSDNSLSRITCGYRFSFNQNSAALKFRIDNLFDKSYQTIAYYPQPGRSFFLILSLRFKA